MGYGVLDQGSPGYAIAVEASSILGLDVPALSCDADSEQLRPTDVAQPLLLLHSVGLLQALPQHITEQVVAVAGHSLGEYTGLVASGCLPWQDALRLVQERGLAMAAASTEDQGMSAVLGLDGDVVAQAIQAAGIPGVVVANYNAPGQVVLSGDFRALQPAADALTAAGARRVIPLAVSGAFHSPLMAAAAERLGQALDAAPLHDAGPQAFNVDGGVRTEAGQIREALRAQLTSAVRWTDCIATLLARGVDRFVELGQGGTLTALGKRIAADATWTSIQRPDEMAAL